jgi:hypothetical protein
MNRSFDIKCRDPGGLVIRAPPLVYLYVGVHKINNSLQDIAPHCTIPPSPFRDIPSDKFPGEWTVR